MAEQRRSLAHNIQCDPQEHVIHKSKGASSLVYPFRLVVVALLCGVAHAFAATDTLVVLHTNDFHGYISADGDRAAGLARIAAYFKQERQRNSNVLALDAGDCVSGTPVSTLFQGRPIYEVMTAAGYDASALGNHEFDYGWREILNYRDLADFPLLSANARDPQGQLIADAASVQMDVGPLRVGIIGLTTEDTRRITITAGNEGVSFDGEVSSVRRQVKTLRDEVDLLLLLSHAGHGADSVIAATIDGIDLIVSGHSHTLLKRPQFVRQTAIVRVGAYTSHLGHVSILRDRDTGDVTVEGFAIPAAELPAEDPEVAALVAAWEARVSKLVDVSIGHTERSWNKRDMYTLVEYILQQHAKADAGFYNEGGIRNLLFEGEITARHLWNIEPFGNHLAVVRILGKNVVGQLAWRFKQQGKSIDPERLYTIATNSFVVEDARRETLVGVTESVEIADTLIRDILIDYVRSGAALDTIPTLERRKRQHR